MNDFNQQGNETPQPPVPVDFSQYISSNSGTTMPQDQQVAPAAPMQAQPAQAQLTPAQPAQVSPAEVQPMQAQPAQFSPTPVQPAQAQPAQFSPTPAPFTTTQPAQTQSTSVPFTPAQPTAAPFMPGQPMPAGAMMPQVPQAQSSKPLSVGMIAAAFVAVIVVLGTIGYFAFLRNSESAVQYGETISTDDSTTDGSSGNVKIVDGISDSITVNEYGVPTLHMATEMSGAEFVAAIEEKGFDWYEGIGWHCFDYLCDVSVSNADGLVSRDELMKMDAETFANSCAVVATPLYSECQTAKEMFESMSNARVFNYAGTDDGTAAIGIAKSSTGQFILVLITRDDGITYDVAGEDITNKYNYDVVIMGEEMYENRAAENDWSSDSIPEYWESVTGQPFNDVSKQ